MATAPDDPRTARLRDNVRAVRRRIEDARGRGPHAAEAVELVVVTKSQEVGIFRPLRAAGVVHVGENRVPSAAARRPQAPAGFTWHGIGHLQRNKARTAVATFDVFHALDSLRLADRLQQLLEERGRTWPVYLQVNAAQDAAKGGWRPEEALEALAALASRPRLEPAGFMTMAAQGAEEAELRRTFRTLRDVRDEALRRGRAATAPQGLSMGMSNDFEVAVEEGATLVRVGRAIFAGVGMRTSSAPGDSGGAADSAGEPS